MKLNGNIMVIQKFFDTTLKNFDIIKLNPFHFINEYLNCEKLSSYNVYDEFVGYIIILHLLFF